MTSMLTFVSASLTNVWYICVKIVTKTIVAAGDSAVRLASNRSNGKIHLRVIG